MPRPQRTKVVPLMSNTTSAPKQRAASTTKTTHNRRTERVISSSKAKSSSDSDILGPQADGNDDPSIMMTGALHLGDLPAVSTRKSSRGKTVPLSSSQSQDRPVRKGSRTRGRPGKITSTSHTPSSTNVETDGEADIRALTPHKDQIEEAVATPQTTELTLGISSEVLDDDDSAHLQAPMQLQSGLNSRRTSVQRPASVIRASGTPGMDSSVLALTRFKRRKRQGSIVGRMQRSAIFGSSHVGSYEVDSQLDQTNFDLDDFNPDDESTPLHGTIMKDSIQTTSSRKRRFDGSPIDRAQSRIPQSSSPLSSQRRESDDLPEAGSDADIIPETAPATQNGVVQAQMDDDEEITSSMAPPLSSSVLAPSSSPIIGEAARGAHHRSVHMSTIELTSLLPKTRNRRNLRRGTRNVFELNESNTDITSDDVEQVLESPAASSEEDEDEQDQSFASTRRTRSTRKKQAPKAITKSKNPLRPKPVQAAKKSIVSGKDINSSKPKRKSYRKAVEEEKENEEDMSYAAEHDVLDDTTVVETAKTMKKLKAKFAEIDEFEMSFETVDVGGENSLWR